MGAELRGKTLGVVGFGRIGQEVAARARAFGMEIVAHDPFIAAQRGGRSRRRSSSSSTICARAPTTSRCTCRRRRRPGTCSTRTRLARCKKGVRIVNTARGELIDEAALADAIESRPRRRRRARRVRNRAADRQAADVAAAGRRDAAHRRVDRPRRRNWSASRPRSHVRDFLRDGVIRNAVNFPSVPPDDVPTLRPFLAARREARRARGADG